jgi:hypothetical protein
MIINLPKLAIMSLLRLIIVERYSDGIYVALLLAIFELGVGSWELGPSYHRNYLGVMLRHLLSVLQCHLMEPSYGQWSS